MVTIRSDAAYHFNPGVDRDGWCDALHIMPPLRRDEQHLTRLKDYLRERTRILIIQRIQHGLVTSNFLD